MASNNDYSNSENILVKVDQNNLVYVDPNSVVDSDGQVQPRGHKQENLVMYLNLEADLVPRTTLISDDNVGNTLTQIASGKLDFLRNATGDGNFDSTWTDSFVPKPIQGQETTYQDGFDVTFGENEFKDPSGQTFGIESVSISVKGANYVPQVTINFIDVRGKTLFESSENSPYRAFFHLPWPIFYLTVKGYYGKAIRYRLHMTKFSSKFNESNGNFEITTTFVGSTFAWMNDIPLSAIINCPYMYLVEETKNTTFNEKTGLYERRLSQSSKGYTILKSIYRQYESKGLIPRGFPVRTLREMGYIAETLDKILEQQIFGLIGVDVFQGIKELDESITDFENSVRAWGQKFLSNETFTLTKKNTENENIQQLWYYLKRKDKTVDDDVVGDKSGSLVSILNLYNNKINQSKLFTNDLFNKVNDKTGESYINFTSGDFRKITIRKTKDILSYASTLDKKVIVNIDDLIDDIFQIRKSFEEQRKKVEDDIEYRMNEVIKGKEGFGFEPTIRNMFAVLLANAEVYIRLMKDTHNKAFQVSSERKNLIRSLSKESKGEDIYPWPEIKKPQSGGKQNVISYPGDEQLVSKLNSNDKRLWPEVDFVEEFINIVTNRTETNLEQELSRNNVNYVFDSNEEFNRIDSISGIDVISETIPYIDKSYSSFIYELYERVRYFTMFDSFNNRILTELANEEFKNVEQSIEGDFDLIDLAKRINGLSDLISIKTSTVDNGPNGPKTIRTYEGLLSDLSPFDKFTFFKDNIPTTPYIIDSITEPFKFESYIENSTNGVGDLDEVKLNDLLKDYEPEKYRMDIYPFNSTTYLNYIGKQNFTRENFKFNGILKFNTSEGFISSPINAKSWLKHGSNNVDFFSNTISVNGNRTSILNTPYFHNQLYSDFNKLNINGKYAGSSYLLLNSLPFIDLDEQITFNGTSILTSSLFREISATHFIPYHLILKWGSIYHRYKKHLIDGIDILNGALNSSYVVKSLDSKEFFDNNSVVLTYTSLNSISNGIEVTVPSTNNLQVGMKLVVTSIGNGQFSNNTTVTEILNSTTFKVSELPINPLISATIYAVFDKKSTFNITPRVSTINGSPIGVTYTPYIDIIDGVGGPTVSNPYTGYTNVGVNPHYQSIYCQIVNGFTSYDPTIGRDSYEQRTINGGIQHRVRKKTNRNYWDVFIDNSKYVTNDKNYTILPSIGDLEDFKIKNGSSLEFSQELGYKTLWYTNDIVNESFSGVTFPSPYDYFKTLSNEFSLSSNYKKALDLIGTFSPEILEYFESFFLDFSTQKLNEEVPYEIFRNINYSKFQDILIKLSVINKFDNDDNDVNLLIKNTLKNRQRDSAEKITSELMSQTNLIRFTLSNPKEIDPFVLYGFSRVNELSTYNSQFFSFSDVNVDNLNLIKLYIGEDIDNHYLNFFNVNDVKLTEENIRTHRQLILIYAGYVKSGGVNTKKDFIEYLKNEIILKNNEGTITSNGSDVRFTFFMSILLKQFSKLNSVKSKNTSNKINFFKGYNTDQTKIELYNTFKSFNDKWTSGNSIGQRLLLDEFLFLDKANRDIGDKLYLNIDKFLPLLSTKNSSTNLYGAISMMLQGTGLDMRALPAYVNFYGNNLTNKNKITPSKKVASNLFGTFLEVDYQEATPKIIIQLVGQTSKRLDMSNSKPYKFNDDSFYIGSQNNNPLLITDLQSFSRNDLSNSNRVVAFEVSFGDQNQGIFKGLSLDQSTIKNTSESFEVLENLARSSSGAGTYNVDVSLFDYYKQASYKCEVSAMGNVMIQPTMFFYLKNIPMFRGSYWITEVNHIIKSNTISTTFTGTRLPYTSLPDPKDSFVASYRILFDKIQSKAIAKFKQRENNKTETQEVIIYQNVPFITDRNNVYGGRNETLIMNVGINRFGVPFNGFNNNRKIQLIENNGQWLRATVVQIGGKTYNPDTSINMNIANGVKLSDLNGENDSFYITEFELSKSITTELVRTVKTTFKNPKNNKQVIITPNYQLDSTIGPIKTDGPVSIGPSIENHGMAFSKRLMGDLRLVDGDVVYFRME
jgi:hypothetical protein